MATHKKQPVLMQSNQALQASAFVGCHVMVALDEAHSIITPTSQIFVDLPKQAGDLFITVYSLNNNVLVQIHLISPGMGLLSLRNYLPGRACRVMVRSRDSLVPVLLSANVDSVSLGKEGEDLRLNIAGFGAIAFEQLRFLHPECQNQHSEQAVQD